MCTHQPPCPPPRAPDREAARTVISHPEQGWSLLCNGVILFEDTGELLPGGGVVQPHRPTDIGVTGTAPRPVPRWPKRRPNGWYGPGRRRPAEPEPEPELTPTGPADTR
jgi:hypothetical protein